MPSLGNTNTNGPSGFETHTLSVTKPTGVVAGDIILIGVTLLNFAATSMTAACSGFTQRGTSPTTQFVATTFFEKVADGSEGASFTVTAANESYIRAFGVRIPSATFDAVNSTDSAGGFDGAHNIPSLTTTAASDLLVAIVTGSTDTVSTPSGWTLTQGPLDTASYLFTKTAGAAGATGSTTITPLDTDRWAVSVIAYKDAAGGAGGLRTPLWERSLGLR